MEALVLEGAFTPVESLIGGVLLGICVYYIAAYNGKVTGISGIVSSVISLDDYVWRLLFLVGMIGTGAVLYWARLVEFGSFKEEDSLGKYAIAGLLVGFGTKLGSGCTSGHMLCGISRLSVRSIVATASFFSTAVAVASFFGRGNDSPVNISWPSAGTAGILTAIPVVLILIFEALRMLRAHKVVSEQFASLAASFVGGVAFALGLSISGMVLQSKVLGFLDPFPFKHWDPSLLMVVVGGLLPNMVLYHVVIQKMTKPVFANKFSLPSKKELEWSLVIGGVIFGLGWGYMGLCPGPGLVSLPRLANPILVFVVTMVIGMRLFVAYTWVRSKLKCE